MYSPVVEVVHPEQGGVRVAIRRKSNATANGSRKFRQNVRSLHTSLLTCIAKVIDIQVFEQWGCSGQTRGSGKTRQARFVLLIWAV